MTYNCFYFSYGSNMDPDRIANRKEIAPEPPHILAVGKLVNYKLRFSRYSKKNKGGVLDIVEEENSCVYGIIYGINKQYLYLIDKAEGAPYAYSQIRVNVKIERIINNDFRNSEFSNEEYLKCYCYEVEEKSLREVPPSRAYIEQIDKIISRIGYFKEETKIQKI